MSVSRDDALDSVGTGWADIINLLYDKKPEHVDITQVKEKFGGLRFYTTACPAEYSDLVGKMELKSEHVCEFCGKPGKLRKLAWIKTLCNDCYIDHIAYLQINDSKEEKEQWI